MVESIVRALAKKISIVIVVVAMAMNACGDTETILQATNDFYSVGKAVFWTSNNTLGNIVIFIQGSQIGTITMFAPSSPNCDAIGFVTVSKPKGFYSFQAFSQGRQWSGTFEIKDGCVSLKLQ